jgi:hypothetical protein
MDSVLAMMRSLYPIPDHLLFGRRHQKRGNVPLLHRHSIDDPQSHGRLI